MRPSSIKGEATQHARRRSGEHVVAVSVRRLRGPRRRADRRRRRARWANRAALRCLGPARRPSSLSSDRNCRRGDVQLAAPPSMVGTD